MLRQSRAVSPVISTLLTIAVVVVLAATISVFVLGVGETLQDPAPTVAQSSGEFVEQDGFDGGIIRITHRAGDSVSVENIEIAVDATAACGKRARMINLPGPEPPRRSTDPDYFPFDDRNFVRGDASFISQGSPQQKWTAGVLHKETDTRLAAGSFFEFRITGSGCQLQEGDAVEVQVIHLPSNSVIIEQRVIT